MALALQFGNKHNIADRITLKYSNECKGLFCFCRPKRAADVVHFAEVEFCLVSDDYFDKACPLIWEGRACEGTLMTGVFRLATEF